MSKITVEDITDLLLTPAMFGKQTESELELFIAGVIEEQSELLEDVVGSTVYASSTYTKKLKRAEKCMVSAELLSRRKNKVVGAAAANKEETNTKALDKQILDYKTEAQAWIDKALDQAANGSGTDFATGVTVSDHFGGSNA